MHCAALAVEAQKGDAILFLRCVSHLYVSVQHWLLRLRREMHSSCLRCVPHIYMQCEALSGKAQKGGAVLLVDVAFVHLAITQMKHFSSFCSPEILQCSTEATTFCDVSQICAAHHCAVLLPNAVHLFEFSCTVLRYQLL